MLLFSLSFIGAWSLERTRSHLLFFASSYLCVGLAALGQVTFWPHDIGLNTIVAAFLYCLGVLLLGEGVLRRSGRNMARALPLLLAALIFVVAVGLHFFPRTMLTISAFSGGRLDAFGASTFWTWVQITLSLLGAATALGLLAVTSVDVITALRGERDNDPLTGLLNRRGLEWRCRELAAAGGEEVSCIVVGDIDNFKAVNDSYGHATGDAVLAGFARIIRSAARSEDAVGRIGGEEFVVVLRATPLAAAYEFAERLRLDIQRARFDGLPAGRSVTCSFGVVDFGKDGDLWAAVRRADEYLYAAK